MSTDLTQTEDFTLDLCDETTFVSQLNKLNTAHGEATRTLLASKRSLENIDSELRRLHGLVWNFQQTPAWSERVVAEEAKRQAAQQSLDLSGVEVARIEAAITQLRAERYRQLNAKVDPIAAQSYVDAYNRIRSHDSYEPARQR